MYSDTTDTIFLGKHKIILRYLCTVMKADAMVCASINAFKFELGNGGKIPPLSPKNSKGMATSYQKSGDF